MSTASENDRLPVFGKDSLYAARGVGILAVVIGHLHVTYPIPYVFYWHIPLFFFLVGAGILQQRPIMQTVRYVAQDILLYLIAWHIVYGTIVYFIPPFSAMDLHIAGEPYLLAITVDIVRLNSHAVGLVLATWFLIALAGVTVACTLLTRMIPKWGLVPAGAAMLAGGWLLASEAGYVLQDSFPYVQAGQILVGSGFCLLGAAFFGSNRAQKLAVHPVTTVISIVFSGTLLSIYNPIPISISGMSLDDNILSAVTIALCSIQVVLWLSQHLRGWAWLCYLGKLSKAIMTHHLLGVALVNLVFVAAGSLSIESVGALTVHQPQTLWSLYLAVALAVPLGIAWTTSKLGRKLRSH